MCHFYQSLVQKETKTYWHLAVIEMGLATDAKTFESFGALNKTMTYVIYFVIQFPFGFINELNHVLQSL